MTKQGEDLYHYNKQITEKSLINCAEINFISLLIGLKPMFNRTNEDQMKI